MVLELASLQWRRRKKERKKERRRNKMMIFDFFKIRFLGFYKAERKSEQGRSDRSGQSGHGLTNIETQNWRGLAKWVWFYYACDTSAVDRGDSRIITRQMLDILGASLSDTCSCQVTLQLCNTALSEVQYCATALSEVQSYCASVQQHKPRACRLSLDYNRRLSS